MSNEQTATVTDGLYSDAYYAGTYSGRRYCAGILACCECWQVITLLYNQHKCDIITDMTASKHKIVGSSEVVDFPQFNLTAIPAKIDTGADSGALHCTKIEEVTIEGTTTLHFSPFDHPELTIIADEFTTKRVRSSNGEVCPRYFITTKIILQAKEYEINLSLADRTEMTWPVLIGKRFLNDNGFLVDVSQQAPVSLTEENR